MTASAAATPRLAKRRPASHPDSRVRRWLGRLGEVGAFLLGRVRRVARQETRTGQSSHLDGTRGWRLVSRAMCWTHALKARLADRHRAEAAETLDEEPDWPPSRAFGSMPPDDWLVRAIGRALRRGRAKAAEEIAGLATAEVVLQVCADLAEAATLLDCAAVAEKMAAITASAHALLSALGDAVTAAPARLERAPPGVARRAWARALDEMNRMKAMASVAPIPATGTG